MSSIDYCLKCRKIDFVYNDKICLTCQIRFSEEKSSIMKKGIYIPGRGDSISSIGMRTPPVTSIGMRTPSMNNTTARTPHPNSNAVQTPHPNNTAVQTSPVGSIGMQTPHPNSTAVQIPHPNNTAARTPHPNNTAMQTSPVGSIVMHKLPVNNSLMETPHVSDKCIACDTIKNCEVSDKLTILLTMPHFKPDYFYKDGDKLCMNCNMIGKKKGELAMASFNPFNPFQERFTFSGSSFPNFLGINSCSSGGFESNFLGNGSESNSCSSGISTFQNRVNIPNSQNPYNHSSITFNFSTIITTPPSSPRNSPHSSPRVSRVRTNHSDSNSPIPRSPSPPRESHKFPACVGCKNNVSRVIIRKSLIEESMALMKPGVSYIHRSGDRLCINCRTKSLRLLEKSHVRINDDLDLRVRSSASRKRMNNDDELPRKK